jgi:hypothetical protein
MAIPSIISDTVPIADVSSNGGGWVDLPMRYRTFHGWSAWTCLSHTSAKAFRCCSYCTSRHSRRKYLLMIFFSCRSLSLVGRKVTLCYLTPRRYEILQVQNSSISRKSNHCGISCFVECNLTMLLIMPYDMCSIIRHSHPHCLMFFRNDIIWATFVFGESLISFPCQFKLSTKKFSKARNRGC